MLSAACGAADGAEAGEPIATGAEGFTWVRPENANFSRVPSWSKLTATDFFFMVRDERWLHQVGKPFFERRISWLYPDEGCEARAEIVCYRAKQSLLTKPYKLFANGRMRPKTTNHVDRVVTWGVHVAPVVKNSATGTPYLFDPVLDPTRMLTYTSWLQLLRPEGPLVVAVEDPSKYSPLAQSPKDIDDALDEMQNIYLVEEWLRQRDLGRDPNQVLGDNPPW
jgi:hypothetical protein